MAYINNDKLCWSELYNNVSAENTVQDIILNHSKLKVNDTDEKYDKITRKFEPSHDEDVISEAYLDTKLSKIASHISFIEEDYIEIKLRNDKQSVEVLVERAVKKTIQILYDEG